MAWKALICFFFLINFGYEQNLSKNPPGGEKRRIHANRVISSRFNYWYFGAVLKSRFANARQVVAQYKAAEEAYYMANGLYTTDISNLDISFPNCNVVKDMLICDNYFQMDPLNGTGDSSNPSNARLRLLYCPPDAKSLSYEQCLTKAEFLYTVWLDQSSKPGITTCTGTTDLGKKFCKTVS